MDSLTQLALGAAVGEAVAGRQVGRRAALWGAVCGTLPDLDVFVSMGDAVRDFTYHRAASHSVLVMAALTPLVVWLILKLHADTAPQRWRWHALVFLAFATHTLLDCFTVYGTQILWPVVTTPVAWSSVFIIDPLYTVPLLAGVVAALIAARDRRWGYRANTAGLVLSSLYLAWTVGAKLHVEQVARRALDARGHANAALLTTPAPFNSMLWRLVAVDERHYYEGFYSMLDAGTQPRFTRHARRPELIAPLADEWPVRRLQWFTKDFYAASLVGRDVVITDLRMGVEPGYVFRFKVGTMSNPHAHPAPVARLPAVRDWGRMRWVWARIFDPAAR